jgi:D-xylose transport system permease protein
MKTSTIKPDEQLEQSHQTNARLYLSLRFWWKMAYEHITRGNLGIMPVLLGLVMIWLLFQSQNDNFLSARNLSNLILQTGVVGTLSVGMVLVLLVGEIDLSIGAVSGVCAGVMAILLATNHWNPWAAMAATLMLGAAIGAFQGSLIVAVGVPSFIVTLAGLLAWEGVQLILLGDAGELRIQDHLVRQIASGYLLPMQSWIIVAAIVVVYGVSLWRARVSKQRTHLDVPALWTSIVKFALVAVVACATVVLLNSYFGVPFLLVLLLAVALLFTLLTRKTVFGRHVYAIGGNAEAARRAGIKVGSVRIVIFMLTSLLAALGGMIDASRAFAVSTGTGGGTLQLEAIAAAVIGGTSLFGGRGNVYSALLGSLVIVSVENGLDLLGQPSSTKNIATGIILFIAVSIDAISRRRRLAATS